MGRMICKRETQRSRFTRPAQYRCADAFSEVVTRTDEGITALLGITPVEVVPAIVQVEPGQVTGKGR